MHNLFNLRKKYNLEIDQFTKKLNQYYGTSYEVHEIWGWENNEHSPKMKDALILANFFNVSYVEFLPNKMAEIKQKISNVDIRK